MMQPTTSVKQQYLYLCSSVRHLYLAAGLANLYPNIEHHVRMIGQKQSLQNLMLDAFQANFEPFSSFEIHLDGRGVIGKYLVKRAAIREIANQALMMRPAKVFVGNDRRLEFQYTIHRLRENGLEVCGAYIDDGTGSYRTRRYMSAWGAFTDQYVDRPIKKIVYGSWCDRVASLGGTRWTDECYLNFPDIAPDDIKSSKKIIKLLPEWYTGDSFSQVIHKKIAKELERLNFTCPTEPYDAILFLPTSSFAKSQFGSIQRYVNLLQGYLLGMKNIAVKYHPRETEFYFKGDINITVLPSTLPAEALFSFVSAKNILGDLSSAVLSSFWLQPEAQTKCLWPRALKKPPIFTIIKKTGIPIEEF